MCNIKQNFHSFYADPPQRDFLGNGPSPADSTYGLSRTAIDDEEKYGKEAKKFICHNFYVNDGLTSLSSTQGATDLIKNVQATLATANR